MPYHTTFSGPRTIALGSSAGGGESCLPRSQVRPLPPPAAPPAPPAAAAAAAVVEEAAAVVAAAWPKSLMQLRVETLLLQQKRFLFIELN